MRKVLRNLLAASIILTSGCAHRMVSVFQSAGPLPTYKVRDVLSNSETKRDFLIAIFSKDENGKEDFLCSGFVISDNLAITAGHCVTDNYETLSKEVFEIKDSFQRKTGTTAKPIAVNISDDVGLLWGNFQDFNKAEINPHGPFSTQGPFVTCGFPWGGKQAVCTQFIPMANNEFLEKGHGNLYPGMSGGPAIDLSNQTVVGINSSVGDGYVNIATTVGILGALELELEK